MLITMKNIVMNAEFKGVFQLKITHVLFQTCITFLILWEPHNVEALWLPLYGKKPWDISQNVSFYIRQRKGIYTDLEHVGE